MRVAALFAGIGGIEAGLEDAGGYSVELLCESWVPARRVLASRFALSEDDIDADVAELTALPSGIDVLTAGFPCTDLSQAGRTAGIGGSQSGLVGHVFRLLEDASRRGDQPRWLMIENVPNMLQLDRGQAMRFLVGQLERLGMRWAYRVVDSRFTGVPQRRRRVVLVASSTDDPRGVLFADEHGSPPLTDLREDAFGFYWTEGRSGVGWARDAVPPLKGGSALGIPSPPSIWVPAAPLDRSFVLPSIEDAEALQGFPRGWTAPADTGGRNGPRWQLVGNAVTVGVASWVGRRLDSPGDWADNGELWDGTRAWPTAAHGEDGKVWRVQISEFPHLRPYTHLTDVVDTPQARGLSYRAINGFRKRLEEGNLGQYPGFRDAVTLYAEHTESL